VPFIADPIPTICSDIPVSSWFCAVIRYTVNHYDKIYSLRRTVDVAGRQRLRSSDVTTLVVPSMRRSTFGDRAFPIAAPRTWNRLPASVRAATSLSTFRQELKTFLFRSSYYGWTLSLTCFTLPHFSDHQHTFY